MVFSLSILKAIYYIVTKIFLYQKKETVINEELFHVVNDHIESYSINQ